MSTIHYHDFLIMFLTTGLSVNVYVNRKDNMHTQYQRQAILGLGQGRYRDVHGREGFVAVWLQRRLYAHLGTGFVARSEVVSRGYGRCWGRAKRSSRRAGSLNMSQLRGKMQTPGVFEASCSDNIGYQGIMFYYNQHN